MKISRNKKKKSVTFYALEKKQSLDHILRIVETCNSPTEILCWVEMNPPPPCLFFQMSVSNILCLRKYLTKMKHIFLFWRRGKEQSKQMKKGRVLACLFPPPLILPVFLCSSHILIFALGTSFPLYFYWFLGLCLLLVLLLCLHPSLFCSTAVTIQNFCTSISWLL